MVGTNDLKKKIYTKIRYLEEELDKLLETKGNSKNEELIDTLKTLKFLNGYIETLK